jgi:transposase
MTINGVNAVVAISVLAAIGDIHRFSSPAEAGELLRAHPRIRQSGDRPAYQNMLCEVNPDCRSLHGE